MIKYILLIVILSSCATTNCMKIYDEEKRKECYRYMPINIHDFDYSLPVNRGFR